MDHLRKNGTTRPHNSAQVRPHNSAQVIKLMKVIAQVIKLLKVIKLSSSLKVNGFGEQLK